MRTGTAPGTKRAPKPVERLDTIIVRIGHIQVRVAVDRHIRWVVKLAWPVAIMTELKQGTAI